MTRCHFRLAGGPLSMMIYWFSSLLLWLVAVVLPSSSSPGEMTGTNSCSRQRGKIKDRKVHRKTESLLWRAAQVLMLHPWRGAVWTVLLCDISAEDIQVHDQIEIQKRAPQEQHSDQWEAPLWDFNTMFKESSANVCPHNFMTKLAMLADRPKTSTNLQ